MVRSDKNIDYVETSVPRFIDDFKEGELINSFSTKEEIEADYMDVLKSYAGSSEDEDKKGKRGKK